MLKRLLKQFVPRKRASAELTRQTIAPAAADLVVGEAEEGLTATELEVLRKSFEVVPVQDGIAKIGPDPLVVVINRSIFTLSEVRDRIEEGRPPGGAAGALHGALKAAGGGILFSTATTELERKIARSNVLISSGGNAWVRYVYVPDDMFQLFYNEFANPALWLIQHGMGDAILPRLGPQDLFRRSLSSVGRRLKRTGSSSENGAIFGNEVERAYQEGYKAANLAYAEAIVTTLGPAASARVLVQDYHFYLLAHYLRQLGSSALLHHFIHIPWVSPHYLQRVMPEEIWRELLSGLLENDAVGFQIPSFCHDFMAAARGLLGAEVDFENGLVTYAGRTTLVQDYPISVDVGYLRQTAIQGEQGAATLATVQGLRQKIGQKILIARADRVDLSKGIVEGFEALDLALQRAPTLAQQVQFLALLQPSRSEVPEYENLLRQVLETVERVNRKWTPEAEWSGIVQSSDEKALLDEDLRNPAARTWPLILVDLTDKPFTEVLAAQIAADVALVNPIADGMNLVAKEVAINNKPSFIRDMNHRLRRNGGRAAGVVPAVIIGSIRMGAYAELRDGLISVDPLSVEGTAAALLRAIRMQMAVRSARGEELTQGRPAGAIRRWLRRPLLPEVLADRAAEQVSRSTITDWMDRIMVDVELLGNPGWEKAIQARGLRHARSLVERGVPLADA